MFYRRTLLDPLKGSISRNKIRLLFGARQTGKTELLRRISPPEGTLYLDLGATDERRRYESDPSRLGREARALPSRIRTIVVDEIQKVPALLDEIQNLYDERRTRFQIFLTGSSARKLRRHSSNLLPGRCHTWRLAPVTLWETAARPSTTIPGSPPPVHSGAPKPFPAQSLPRTLLLGNLPGIRTEPEHTASATLRAYVENYLEEEIRREALAQNLGAFAVFLRLAAIESGSQVNIAKLSKESGIPAASLRNYYQVLEDTFTGFWLGPYGRKGRKRLLTTPRFLFFDTGVRNAAAELPSDKSILSTEGPRLLENWVGLELLCRASYLGAGYRVSFWRAVSGAEVDFVWETPREDIPIEVKWTAHPDPTDARGIESFLADHGTRARRGIIVCRTPRPEQITERVVAVPWAGF